MNRKRMIALACALGVMAIAIPTALASDPGAGKAPLVPNVEAFCSGGLVNPPSPLPTGNGFVVLNAANGVVSGEVSVKNATPNTTYNIDLVQTPSGTDCFVYNFSLTTNSQGNGNVHVSAPQHAGDTGAFVDLFYGNISDFYNSPNVIVSN